jgi:hypothetical protein
LFGSCDKGDLKECKINNIGLIDGAYNIYIRSATPSNGSGGGLGEAGSISTTIESAVEFQTAQINVEKTGLPGEGIDPSNNYNNWPNPFLQNFTPAAGVTLPGLARSETCSWRVVKNASDSVIVDAGITPFIWGPITEQSVLNGPFGNPIPLPPPGAPDGDAYQCANGGAGAANIRNSDVKVWQASYESGSVIKPQITFTDSEGTQQTVDVTLGFGHGVGYYDPASKATKNLGCGQVALVRQCQDQGGFYTNDNCESFEYIAVMRTGTIAWSYEITPPASIALAANNYGDTCYIPQTALLPDSNVNDILTQLRASDGMDGEEPSASTTNFTGNNQWGNCRNLMPDGSAGTLENVSQFQCGANGGKCGQPYAWPFYYYDKFESRAMGQGNPGGISGIKPEILRVQALADAKTMCSAVTPLSWASTPVEDKKSDSEGEPIVSFPQIAAVWKAAVASEPYGAPDIINNVCAEAIVVAAGECQDVASKDLPPNWKGACKMLQLWGGTGASPDAQAAEILSSSQLGNCNTQTTIPDLWISAGNNNLIDTVFCHMNNNGGVVFGGGMCSGEGAASIGAKLSIYYTGSLASLSCQSAGASAAVTIPKGQTALISGSGSAAKVTCYGSSTVVYTPTGSGADASWKSSPSGDACNIVSAGNVTCAAN